MKIFENILKKFHLSSKNPNDNMLTAKQSMEAIYNVSKMLDEKAMNLQEKFPEIRKSIHEYCEEIAKIQPSVSVRAGKFEQALAQQITKVSTECDRIFTSKDSKELLNEVNNLARVIRERQNADSSEE